MFRFNDDFNELIDECLEYTRHKKETIIKEWLNKIGYTDPVGYDISFGPNVAEIYTTHPGVLIGKYGVKVNEFAEMLTEAFGGKWQVKFTEIRGGFVNV